MVRPGGTYLSHRTTIATRRVATADWAASEIGYHASHSVLSLIFSGTSDYFIENRLSSEESWCVFGGVMVCLGLLGNRLVKASVNTWWHVSNIM